MNIFEHHLSEIKKLIISEKDSLKLKDVDDLHGVNLEVPPEQFNFDLSCNIAMVLGKKNKINPKILALKIKDIFLNKINNFSEIDIAGPGFLNIKLSRDGFAININNILENRDTYGSKKSNKTYNIEFVSANPTGPMHVGHCRGAIFGDVLSNLLLFNGNKVTKEFYINDYGNQIKNFVESVYLRIREIKYNEEFPKNDENLYPGDYLIEIARNIINQNKELNFENYEEISEKLTELAVSESLNLIKINLNNLGIKHDNFVSEKSIVLNKEVNKTIEKLKSKNLVYQGKIKAPERKQSSDYKEREQLLFKSTLFGDDKDRALQKSDMSWTYFASDTAYHNNKLERGFDKIINILGSDHTGYVKRINSIVEALSGEKEKLICKVSQLVKLIKDGKPFKMSKRKGDYITVEDLINEVGKDATRFIMLNRSSDVELDFDFSKVKEKSKDNPIYYVQYCYARISSVFRNLNKNITDDINIDKFDFVYSNEEQRIFRKIAEWPACIDLSCKKLEPHRVSNYLYELSSEFHAYWNLGKDNINKRFIINDTITNEKIVLLKSVSNVIKIGMNILGVKTPDKM